MKRNNLPSTFAEAEFESVSIENACNSAVIFTGSLSSKYSKTFFILSFLLSIVLSLTSCGGSGVTRITGRYVSISSDRNYIIRDSEDGSENIIRLYIAPDTDVDFSELTTGDIIEIKIVFIQSDGILSYTEVFDYTKKADGAEEDIKSSTLNEIYQLNTLFEN